MASLAFFRRLRVSAARAGLGLLLQLSRVKVGRAYGKGNSVAVHSCLLHQKKGNFASVRRLMQIGKHLSARSPPNPVD